MQSEKKRSSAPTLGPEVTGRKITDVLSHREERRALNTGGTGEHRGIRDHAKKKPSDILLTADGGQVSARG